MTNCLASWRHCVVRAFKFSDHCIKRAGHIRACVAIWHWVYVHPVDAWGVSLHRVAEGHYRLADLICTEEFHGCHRVEASKEGAPFSYLTAKWEIFADFL
jgi:hypothetical protein